MPQTQALRAVSEQRVAFVFACEVIYVTSRLQSRLPCAVKCLYRSPPVALLFSVALSGTVHILLRFYLRSTFRDISLLCLTAPHILIVVVK